MKTRFSFLACAMIAVWATACSSSSSGGGATTDTGGGGNTDTGVAPGTDGGGTDGGKSDTAKADGAGGTDSSTDAGAPDLTVGKPCTDDSTCDVTGAGITACSNGLFTDGTLDPTPVCLGTDCDPGDGTTIETCDGGRGVCLDDGSGGGQCFPSCTFATSDGAAPKGCEGKNVCNVLGWGKDASGTLAGVGYCFGGCLADGDCTGGDKCQKETGLCVKTPDTYTKAQGDPCTDSDTTCSCLYLTTLGYCSNFCLVGSSATSCPTGFVCSPDLPTTDSTDGSALFSKDPTGIAGTCLKTCAADADCATMNSTCQTTATGKVCYPKS